MKTLVPDQAKIRIGSDYQAIVPVDVKKSTRTDTNFLNLKMQYALITAN